ncbi:MULTISPECIES: hypothetical protein [Bacillus cereus group]|uniref:Uncharacterized protein n=1 Tax=Bacillus anthracis TaxID=1392 RepID=A0A0J1HUT9_BACAN|nr:MULTISPECIES: hypothetical protein [Bacillus cereus group]KLV17472.1 hypothetical protein ABW01_16420 [Bacillus anthracis]MDC2943339.1 hypothetical protein [Bacillus thuringiensis]
MTTFVVMVSIFLILFVIGPKATKRKEERDRIEKEHKEKMERDVDKVKFRINKQPKLKHKVFIIKNKK